MGHILGRLTVPICNSAVHTLSAHACNSLLCCECASIYNIMRLAAARRARTTLSTFAARAYPPLSIELKRPTTPIADCSPFRQRTSPRSQAEHAALCQSLQCDDLRNMQIPSDALSWPKSLLQRYCEAGGRLTLQALSEQPPDSLPAEIIDRVGEGLPVRALPILDVGSGGLLGSLEGSESTGIRALAHTLISDGHVACRLGLGADMLSGLRTEGERAWSFMRPGEIRARDGTVVAGRAPSGALRGDRHLLFRELSTQASSSSRADACSLHEEDWPAFAMADAAMGSMAAALAGTLRDMGAPEGLGRIAKRSDSFIARFPGDGLGYGAHFDGDELCQVTLLLYTSEGWDPAHGGALHMLDEAAECWFEVPPVADTLVAFRSDRVLHRVQPCCGQRPRVALTQFLSQGTAYLEHQAQLSALAFSV